MTSAPYTPRQLDALCEVANVGTGQGADTLSHLLGLRLETQPPSACAIASASEWPGLNAAGWVAMFTVQGGIEAALMLALPKFDAEEMLFRLLKSSGQGLSTDKGQDALREAGNIAASAYLNAVAALTKLQLVPSVPSLLAAPKHLEVAKAWVAGGSALVLDGQFRGTPLSGRLWFVMADKDAHVLLGRLGVMR
ncbi:MAG: chemotaxis protein CheC [Myxococcaceae bacterium]